MLMGTEDYDFSTMSHKDIHNPQKNEVKEKAGLGKLKENTYICCGGVNS